MLQTVSHYRRVFIYIYIFRVFLCFPTSTFGMIIRPPKLALMCTNGTTQRTVLDKLFVVNHVVSLLLPGNVEAISILIAGNLLGYYVSSYAIAIYNIYIYNCSGNSIITMYIHITSYMLLLWYMSIGYCWLLGCQWVYHITRWCEVHRSKESHLLTSAQLQNQAEAVQDWKNQWRIPPAMEKNIGNIWGKWWLYYK